MDPPPPPPSQLHPPLQLRPVPSRRGEREPARAGSGQPGGRKWWALELAAAIGILLVVGLLLSPATPRPPTPEQLWAYRSDPSIVALARDVVGLQAQLGGQPAPSAGVAPAAHTPAASAVDRLRRDLSRARSVPGAPDPVLQRAWVAAIDEVTAAVRILGGPALGKSRPGAGAGARAGAGADAGGLAAARADLDAAGQTLVAVSAAIRSAGTLHQH